MHDKGIPSSAKLSQIPTFASPRHRTIRGPAQPGASSGKRPRKSVRKWITRSVRYETILRQHGPTEAAGYASRFRRQGKLLNLSSLR